MLVIGAKQYDWQIHQVLMGDCGMLLIEKEAQVGRAAVKGFYPLFVLGGGAVSQDVYLLYDVSFLALFFLLFSFSFLMLRKPIKKY